METSPDFIIPLIFELVTEFALCCYTAADKSNSNQIDGIKSLPSIE